MRVMLISHACVHPSYMRSKVRSLLEVGQKICLLLITPSWWVEGSIKVKGKSTTISHDRELRCHVLALRAQFTGMQYAHFYPTLHLIMRWWRPEIVHVEEEPMSLSCAHAAILCKTLLNGSPFIFFTWENIHQQWRAPNLRGLLYPFFERLSFLNANLAIAGTSMAMRILRERGFDKPIVICPQFGVDVERFSPLPTERRLKARSNLGVGDDNETLVVGYVGRLIYEKGVDMLIHAVASLPNTKLLIAGDGKMRQQLQRLIEELNLSGRVKLLGAIPHERLHEFLNALDVLVLPSRSIPHWKEQFGRVLVEAMACGIPVVGSSCGAIPEVVGDAGLIFREGDIEGLRSTLKLMMDKDLRTELSMRGRVRAVECFSERSVALSTLLAYEMALTQRR
ncbi:MAG: hypothetical protein RUDDFDWM_001319 [Candidatus Fervidibacterota bacterium]